MKRALLGLVGILAGVSFVVPSWFAFIHLVGYWSYENQVRRHFASPEAIRALATLYERVEKEGRTLEPVGAKVRGIPYDWMPQEFSREWRLYYVGVSRVVALFDDRRELVAIEFQGSRCGCFVSRDAERCPSSFRTLERFAISPLFVTGRVGDNP
jgi:hypothetical protein